MPRSWWKWLVLMGNAWKWLEMPWNGWKWLKTDGIGQKETYQAPSARQTKLFCLVWFSLFLWCAWQWARAKACHFSDEATALTQSLWLEKIIQSPFLSPRWLLCCVWLASTILKIFLKVIAYILQILHWGTCRNFFEALTSKYAW